MQHDQRSNISKSLLRGNITLVFRSHSSLLNIHTSTKPETSRKSPGLYTSIVGRLLWFIVATISSFHQTEPKDWINSFSLVGFMKLKLNERMARKRPSNAYRSTFKSPGASTALVHYSGPFMNRSRSMVWTGVVFDPRLLSIQKIPRRARCVRGYKPSCTLQTKPSIHLRRSWHWKDF